MKSSTLPKSADERAIGRQDGFVSVFSPLETHNRAPWNNLACALLVYLSRDAVGPLPDSTDWNLFFTSIGIALIALVTMVAHGNVSRNYWSGLNVVAGGWLIVSTYTLPSAPGLFWAQICLGVLTLTTALTSLANERGSGGSGRPA